MNTYLSLFYGFIAIFLLAGIYWIHPREKGWLYYMITLIGFLLAGIIIKSYALIGSSLLSLLLSFFKYRQYLDKNRPIEVILIPDRDDHFLNYFLNYYRKDILKYFPHFDFRIEDEFLVALLFSNMETIGLVIAEIRDQDTLKICIDYMVPKHRNSQLARTFYQCELRCIDFLGFRRFYIEPQSKQHNDYLERIGFKLVDGKYVISHDQK